MTIFLILLSILFTTTAQLLLKYSANKNNFINFPLFIGYGLFFIVVVISYFLMYKIKLKLFTAIMGVNYVTVVVASALIYKESLKRKKILAVLIITLGVVIFNL